MSVLAVVRIVIIVISGLRKSLFAIPASVVVNCIDGYGLGVVLAVAVWLWRAQILLYSSLGSVLRINCLGGGNMLCWCWMSSSGVVSCS